jgi:hypothetical protein
MNMWCATDYARLRRRGVVLEAVMDDQLKTRKASLISRQNRRRRTPLVLDSWRSRGASVSVAEDMRCEQLIDWLRLHWIAPHDHVDQVNTLISEITSGESEVYVADFWSWEEAVVVVAASENLSQFCSRLRDIYPDGYLVANRRLSRALLVSLDEDTDGAEVSLIDLELPLGS